MEFPMRLILLGAVKRKRTRGCEYRAGTQGSGGRGAFEGYPSPFLNIRSLLIFASPTTEGPVCRRLSYNAMMLRLLTLLVTALLLALAEARNRGHPIKSRNNLVFKLSFGIGKWQANASPTGGIVVSEGQL